MVKTIYTWQEFKKYFPNVTAIKKMAKSYQCMTVYEITKTGKINKRVGPTYFDIGYDGKWADLNEFRQFNPSDIYRYTLPSMARNSKGNIIIVFTKHLPRNHRIYY